MNDKKFLNPDSMNNGSDISVYDNNILMFADEYIKQNNLQDKQSIHDNFLDLLNYITAECNCKYLPDDIISLQKVLDTYLLLCEKYDYIPDAYGFSKFIKSDAKNVLSQNIYKVNSGDKKASPEVRSFYKKAMGIFKQALVHTVTESRGADVNRIFILKAVHGMAETQPQTVEAVQTSNAGDILSSLGLESK